MTSIALARPVLPARHVNCVVNWILVLAPLVDPMEYVSDSNRVDSFVIAHMDFMETFVQVDKLI